MKTTQSFVVSGAALLLLVCPGAVVAQNFYFNVNPGVIWMQNVSFRGDGDSGTIKFYPGPSLDFVGGYNFTESLAGEVETGVHYLRSSSTRESDFVEVHEALVQIPIMANLRFQIPTHSNFRPFAGVGVGGVYSELDDDDWFGTTNVGHDFTFGYQAFVGMRFQVSQTVELGAQYRFMGTLDHNLGRLHLGETYTHTVAMVISLRF